MLNGFTMWFDQCIYLLYLYLFNNLKANSTLFTSDQEERTMDAVAVISDNHRVSLNCKI